jgi:hypothetical protein
MHLAMGSAIAIKASGASSVDWSAFSAWASVVRAPFASSTGSAIAQEG